MKNEELLPIDQTQALVPTQDYSPPCLVPPTPLESSVVKILDKIAQGEFTQESALALEKTLAVVKDIRADNAKRAYAAAMAALQAELPPVPALGIIPTKGGVIRSRFPKDETVKAHLAPYLKKYGFSMDTGQRMSDAGDRVTAILTITHVEGHARTFEFTCHIGNGPPESSDSQADASAVTMAARQAMLKAFNLSDDENVDARLDGSPITIEQATELRDGVRAAGLPEATFLKMAGAGAYSEILSGKLDVCRKAISESLRSQGKAVPAKAGPAPAAATDPARAAKLDEAAAYITAVAKATNTKPGTVYSKAVESAGAGKVRLGAQDGPALHKILAHLKDLAERKNVDATPYLPGGPNYKRYAG